MSGHAAPERHAGMAGPETTSAAIRTFGTLADGRPVVCARLERYGFAVEVLNYGAILRAIELPRAGHPSVNVVLGYGEIAAYERDRAYLGALVGRCANRIDGATFSLDGRPVRLTANAGPHHLHGGQLGIGKALWSIRSLENRSHPRLVLAHHSPDGDEGYPGALEVEAVFELDQECRLRIEITAQSDRMTVANFAPHPYFNLSGDPHSPVLSHELRIAGQHFLPVRPDMIPTGELLPVAGTPFDFREAACIGQRIVSRHPQVRLAGGFDHNWVLDRPSAAVAELSCARSGIGLEITTNQAGLQFYCGNSLRAGSGGAFADRCGLCLEPQGFPNAVNESRFPSVLLRPGQAYHHCTVYRFRDIALGSDAAGI